MPSGFIDRYKGKGFQPSGWLQQIGSGGAATPGGGQINSTATVTASSGGALLSTAGTVETTLLSYALPARTLDRLGRNLFIAAYGVFSTGSAGTKTARLYYGSEAIAVTTVNSSLATPGPGQPWYLQMSVFAQSAMSTANAIQTMVTQSILSSVHGGCSILTGNENTLANSTIKVTGISSSPSSGINDVVAYSLQIEGLN